LLSRSHIFALGSDTEGLPLVIIEAMRAGLPVVASNVGGVSELVIDGVTGYAVRNDPALFARRMQELADSSALRSRMGRQSRMRYEENFKSEMMIAETSRLYDEVVTAAS
jgi:glycosyltransferase involved in cell wall biosynthesis